MNENDLKRIAEDRGSMLTLGIQIVRNMFYQFVVVCQSDVIE